jgi:hypothetical protein
VIEVIPVEISRPKGNDKEDLYLAEFHRWPSKDMIWGSSIRVELRRANVADGVRHHTDHIRGFKNGNSELSILGGRDLVGRDVQGRFQI